MATESSLFTPAVNGSELKVTAGETTGFGYVNVTVDDGQTQWTQRFGVAVKGMNTGIQTITNSNVVSRNHPFYDLQGRRIEQPQKGGVYIHNGKKMIVK